MGQGQAIQGFGEGAVVGKGWRVRGSARGAVLGEGRRVVEGRWQLEGGFGDARACTREKEAGGFPWS